MSSRVNRTASSVCAVVCLGLLAWTLPGHRALAADYVYWANFGSAGDGTTIGRANLDGSGADQSFITGCTVPAGVAVDATYVYWTNALVGTIGRANLDGSGADQSFITGCPGPSDVAVDATYVYWANFGSEGGGTTIGRANLDGSGADQLFITGCTTPSAVAVDATYVYWSNFAGTIGRANLDGSGANQSFVTGCTLPRGMAVDAAHVYWTNSAGTIGRANLDGSGANQSLITGCADPAGVVVDATYVYWTNFAGTSVGRANLDGSDADQSFITGCNGPYGVTVSPGATLVEISWFAASREQGGVLVEWQTASEVDNAGFHVWRGETEAGQYARITDALIPAQGGPAGGAKYSHEDTNVEPGRTYWYKLENIDSAGGSGFHGPISVEARSSWGPAKPASLAGAWPGTPLTRGLGAFAFLAIPALAVLVMRGRSRRRGAPGSLAGQGR